MEKFSFRVLFDNFEKALFADGFDATTLNTWAGQPDKPVVVLVHGIAGNLYHWYDPLELSIDATWLFDRTVVPTAGKDNSIAVSPGFKKNVVGDRSWCKALMAQNISYITFSQRSSSGPINIAMDELTKILKGVISIIYEPLVSEGNNPPPLVILCHSRGGLVTRFVLKNLKKAGVPYLSQVISLCTPHGGSYLPKLSKNYSEFMEGLSNNLDDIQEYLKLSHIPAKVEEILEQFGKFLNQPPGASLATEVGFQELIPENGLFEALEKDEEPLSGVSYYSFAGSVPAFVNFYFKESGTHILKLFTFSNSTLIDLLVDRLPWLNSHYGGLAELGEGDSSVALSRSKWPSNFNAIHQEFPVHHMEALIDPKLQETVINLIQGEGFAAKGEILLSSGNTLQAATSSAWLADPTFSAIHDAFLLGWTNIELKSRLKISVSDRTLAALDPLPIDSSSLSTGHESGIIDFLLRQVNTFIKDRNNPGTRSEIDDTVLLKLTSKWRALFNRLAALHFKRFSQTPSISGDYDRLKSKTKWLRLQEILSLSDAGITTLTLVKEGKVITKEQLENFWLYDTTRRSINCLALLYTDADKDVDSDTIKANQNKILANVSSSNEHKDQAIEKIKDQAVQLLEVWDAYLREQFFSGGQFKNDGIELVAYEAGRSLASISWSVSVKTSSLEKLLQTLEEFPSRLQTLERHLEELTRNNDRLDKYLKSWENNNNNHKAVEIKRSLETLVIKSNSINQTVRQAEYLTAGQRLSDAKPVKFGSKNKSNAMVGNDFDSRKLDEIANLYKNLKGIQGKEIERLFNDDLVKILAKLSRTLKALNYSSVITILKLLTESKTGSLNQYKDEVKAAIKQVWISSFEKSNIIEVQHHILALSNALDEAYYQSRGKNGRPGEENRTMPVPNPELPSLVLQSAGQSLEYWQRMVSLLTPDEKVFYNPSDKPIQPVQANGKAKGTPAKPQNKINKNTTGKWKDRFKLKGKKEEPLKPQILLDKNGKWCRNLRLALIHQSNIWQSLVTGQQNLRSFSNEDVIEKILSDFMDDLAKAEGKLVIKNLVLIVLFAFVAVAAGLLVLFLIANTNASNTLQNIIFTAIAAIGGVSGGNQLVRTITNTAPALGTTNPSAIQFNTTLTALGNTFEKGLVQMKIEFAHLNYYIAVSYPLVEFFIQNQVAVTKQPKKSKGNFSPAGWLEKVNLDLSAIFLGIATGIFINLEIKATLSNVLGTQLFELSDIIQCLAVYLFIISAVITILVSSVKGIIRNLEISNPEVIHNGYEFLSKVIWTDHDREQQITRVVRASFGSIGGFVGALLKSKNH